MSSVTVLLRFVYSQAQRQCLFWPNVYFGNIVVRPEIVPRTSSVHIHISNISNSPCRSLSRFFPPKFQCRDVLRMKSVLRHSCAHAHDFQTALKDTGLRASAHRIATAAERGGGWRWDEAGDLRAEPIKTCAHTHYVIRQPISSHQSLRVQWGIAGAG